MAKVKPACHIWAPEFNRYVCFSFRGNRTIFGWDIANSIFDLEKSRSRSRRKSTKMLSGNLQVRANNCAKNERNPKSCSKVIAWTRICGRRRRRRRRRRRTNRYKNIKSPPVYWGDLITFWKKKHPFVLWRRRCSHVLLMCRWCSIWGYVCLRDTCRSWMINYIALKTAGLTHWGRVTHICINDLTSIGSDNGLSPDRRQAIIRTPAGILLIRTLGTNFSEILSEIHSFSFKKMHLKMSSAKWRLFRLGLNELNRLFMLSITLLVIHTYIWMSQWAVSM